MRSKMTTFAAATPIIEDEARDSGESERDVEQQYRRVQEGDVNAEADHRDDAEEAVEDEQEERNDDQTADRRQLRLLERGPYRAWPRCSSARS